MSLCLFYCMQKPHSTDWVSFDKPLYLTFKWLHAQVMLSPCLSPLPCTNNTISGRPRIPNSLISTKPRRWNWMLKCLFFSFPLGHASVSVKHCEAEHSCDCTQCKVHTDKSIHIRSSFSRGPAHMSLSIMQLY